MASWCRRCLLPRPDFSLFILSLCRDLVYYVATRLLFLVLESLSRHRKVCRDLVYLCSAYLYVATLRSYRDIETSLQLEVCCNIGFVYYDQASSLSKHYMLRPCLSVATNVSSSFSIATYITLSRQIFLLSISLHTLPYRDRGLSLKLFFYLNKLFHVAIISVVTEDPLSQQNFYFLPVSFVATGASLSRQILHGVDILLKNLVAT